MGLCAFTNWLTTGIASKRILGEVARNVFVIYV